MRPQPDDVPIIGQNAAPIVQLESVTVYPPGQEPVTYVAPNIGPTGVDQNGVPFAMVLDAQGRRVDYVGVPFSRTHARPASGLVAPMM